MACYGIQWSSVVAFSALAASVCLLNEDASKPSAQKRSHSFLFLHQNSHVPVDGSQYPDPRALNDGAWEPHRRSDSKHILVVSSYSPKIQANMLERERFNLKISASLNGVRFQEVLLEIGNSSGSVVSVLGTLNVMRLR
jgi:hypothetical protein